MKNYLLLLMLFCTQIAFSQLGITILEGPTHAILCDSSCVMLHANFPKPLRTNQYAISTTAFAPNNISGTVINLNDDKFSGAIPLNFDFCFFQNSYNSCYVSDNGVLTFNANYANASCYNNTQQLFPFFNSTCPDDAIFFMFLDAAPSLGGTISYATIGTTPNRKFVIKYNNMKLFGATCSNTTSSYQVVLNETTNIIEVFIANKTTCDANVANQKNYSTIGIQNIGATVAYTATGKHASIFTASNEGYKIAPSGPIDYTMRWKNALGNIIAVNADSIHFCPNYFPYTQVTAEVSFSCPALLYKDTVVLTKYAPTFTSINIVQPNCNNSPTGSVTINGSTINPPLTYSLNSSPFGASNQFNNIPAGVYTASIKDANGCTKDTTFIIEPIFNVAIIVDSIIKPTCPINNGSATVHAVGGVAPYTYTWSNSAVGTTISNLSPGGYTVIATDANGCTQLMVVNVVWGGLPEVLSVVTKPLCGDSSGSIILNVSGATPPYTYNWTNGAITQSLNNIPAGIYNVTITDSNGCFKYLGYVLLDTLAVITTVSVINTKCGLANGTASVAASGGLAPYTYAWTPSGQNTATAINLAAGTHYCTTTAANGCSKTDIITINSSLATINVLSKANANCDSSNGVVYVLSVTNAASPYSTLWSNAAVGNVITSLAAGNYWVKTTDLIGCIAIDSFYLANDGKPKLNILAYTPPNCFGDSTGSVTLSGSNGVAPYKYSLDSINFFSFAQIDSIPGGLYPVYISDANSCLNDTLINFAQPDEIVVNYVADTVVCFHDKTASLSITASGGFLPYSYAFNNGIYSNQMLYTGLGKGEYPLTVKDNHNCDESFIIKIIGPDDSLHINIVKKDIPCFEKNTGAITLSLEGGWPPYQYTWSNPSLVGLAFANIGEMHESIQVKDDRGCEINMPINLNQLLCCKAVIPNAFTPNGDSRNDELKVLPISDVSTMKLIIANRWGQVLFTTKNINDAWDGKFKGVDCDVDTYFYILEYTCPFKKEKVIEKGDITLIR